MNNSIDELFDILTDLHNEFVIEEKKLKEISSSHAFRIDELEQQINTARKNEDIDFRVFSPRNLSIDNSNKIKALEDEKISLEKEKADADKQMGYYTGKADKLNSAVNIVKRYLKTDIDLNDEKESVIKDISVESVDDAQKINNKTRRNNFSFLYDEEEVDDDSTTEEELDKVEELFKKNNDAENDLITKSITDSYDDSKQVVKNGIPVGDVERVCHKVEISEKIINNDRVRAKMQLKEVITELKDLIESYK